MQYMNIRAMTMTLICTAHPHSHVLKRLPRLKHVAFIFDAELEVESLKKHRQVYVTDTGFTLAVDMDISPALRIVP